jgi:2-polyprenyl-3-methyl-5-hydroxy-6-metoxy-1,4-benzoquinol methylase
MTAMMSPDPLTPEIEAKVREGLLATYFRGTWAEQANSEKANSAIHDHVRGRYDLCRRWLVPWVKNLIDLQKTDVVEIGCGTGSTTAALAVEARSVDAYDIAGVSVEAAIRRIDAFGLHNTRLNQHSPDRLLSSMSSAHAPNSVGMVLCFAVLEHAKHQERLDTIRHIWDILAPGGILVIGDTPNRLSYWDHHTTWLPFFDALPHELALDYADRSPRSDFVEHLKASRKQSRAAAEETLARWGRGVSHHEFELVLGDLAPLVVGDGFDPEPLAYFGVTLETRMLYSYAKLKGLSVPPAFLRSSVEVILRKPGGQNLKSQRPRDLDEIVRPFSL